jgi:hypothetical protein
LAAASLFAQPSPKLNPLSHEYFQRGTFVELPLTGENLVQPVRVIVSGAPGIVANILSNQTASAGIESSLGGISVANPAVGKQVNISISISATAGLTGRELRIVTSNGVSNPVPLRVSDLPEFYSTANNHSLADAQAVELPATINGVINAAAESDFFRVSGRKGQHLIFEVDAWRNGSPLDSSLAILDRTGSELARNEDAVGLDSVLVFEVPQDGQYVVQLRDFRYEGGQNYTYRLRAGELPLVTSSFPFGGKRGETVEVELRGHNLEHANKLTLKLAAESGVGRQELRAATSKGLSNPFLFETSDLPHIPEKEPNDTAAQAQQIAIPSAINGRIEKADDVDTFKFHARKNEFLVFEIFAYRFGSKLDALLTLSDEQGKILTRNDDSSAEDARLEYRFPEEGDYQVSLRDLLHRGGEDYSYRLTLTVPQPNYSVVFLPDAPRIRRGGRVPIRCEVNRSNGFAEAVKISCDDLPSGVYAEPLLIPAGENSGLLLLSADPAAELKTSPLFISGSALHEGQVVTRRAQAIAGEKTALSGFLTVFPAAPFSVEPSTLMANIEQLGTGNIDVWVERKPGFNGQIKIVPEGFSLGRDPIGKSFEFQPLIIKAGENGGTLALSAKLDSEIGTRAIVLRGETDLDNGETAWAYSPLIPVRTSPVPFALTTTARKLAVTALPPGSASAAAEGLFTAKADRRDGFDGEIKLRLEGVPPGVAATVQPIPAGSGEIQVKLVASEKAPTGKDFELKLTGEGIHHDHIFKFHAPAITLTINAPEPAASNAPKLAKTEQ